MQKPAGKSGQDVKTQLEQKRADIRQKIAALQAIDQSLLHLLASCSGQMPVEQCPIIAKMKKQT